jgi:hypothetical protein
MREVARSSKLPARGVHDNTVDSSYKQYHLSIAILLAKDNVALHGIKFSIPYNAQKIKKNKSIPVICRGSL